MWFVDLLGYGLFGYFALCAICGVIFGCMLAYEWWMDKREKKKQDDSMKKWLEDKEEK